MINYLGIDQSLTNTGIAVLVDSRTIYYDSVPTKPITPYWDRLHTIVSILEEYLEEYGPARVYTESPMFCSNHRSGRDLVRVETLIHYTLYNRQTSFNTISPKTWPSKLGLKTTKKELHSLLSPLTPDAMNVDQSDACGVLLGGLIDEGLLPKDFDYLNLTYKLCPLSRLLLKPQKLKRLKRLVSVA